MSNRMRFAAIAIVIALVVWHGRREVRKPLHQKPFAGESIPSLVGGAR